MKTNTQRVFAFMACIIFGAASAHAESTLTLSRPAKTFTNPGPLESTNSRNNVAASLADVPLEIFTLTSKGGGNNVTKVKVAIPSGVVRPISIRMARQVQGGFIDVGTLPVTAGVHEYEFSMPGIQGQVPENAIRTYVIRGSFDQTAFGLVTPHGDFCRVQIMSAKFIPTAGGAEQTLIPFPAFFTPEQRFFRATANWSLASPATVEKTVESGVTTRMLSLIHI